MAKPVERLENPWRVPLLALGGDFMTSQQLGAAAKSAGLSAGALYFRGRVSVLGDVTSATARDVLAIFPERLVDKTWAATEQLSAADASALYLQSCHAWGRAHLGGAEDAERLADLLARVVDAADPAGAALARAWRRVDRPADLPALIAHLSMLLREIRGALHFSALSLVSLPVMRAALVDDLGGKARLLRTGWTSSDVDAITASAERGDYERWREAEGATEGAFVGMLGEALTEPEINVLGRRLIAAYDTSRADA